MNNDHWILDENGKPKQVPFMEWAEWFEEGKNRIVKRTDLNDWFVSTVFLGLDHRFSGKGDPILWETMVFEQELSEFEIPAYGNHPARKRKHHKSVEQYENRYSSKEAAIEDHDRIVNELRKHDSKGTKGAKAS